jgi:hypothetical protein
MLEVSDPQRRFTESPGGVLVPDTCLTLDSLNSQTTWPIPGGSGGFGTASWNSRVCQEYFFWLQLEIDLMRTRFLGSREPALRV